MSEVSLPPSAATGLIRYDSMLRAIAECHAVDEVKDLRDKARALELYAQQARNRDAEARAASIRIRAEHRCGELIREQQAAGKLATQSRHPGSVASHDAAPQTLGDLKISRDQSSRFQKLAQIPKAKLDETLADYESRGDVPTTEGVLARHRVMPPPPSEAALAFGGALRALERVVSTHGIAAIVHELQGADAQAWHDDLSLLDRPLKQVRIFADQKLMEGEDVEAEA